MFMPEFITTEGEVGKVVEHSYTRVNVEVFSLHRMLKVKTLTCT